MGHPQPCSAAPPRCSDPSLGAPSTLPSTLTPCFSCITPHGSSVLLLASPVLSLSQPHSHHLPLFCLCAAPASPFCCHPHQGPCGTPTQQPLCWVPLCAGSLGSACASSPLSPLPFHAAPRDTSLFKPPSCSLAALCPPCALSPFALHLCSTSSLALSS